MTTLRSNEEARRGAGARRLYCTCAINATVEIIKAGFGLQGM